MHPNAVDIFTSFKRIQMQIFSWSMQLNYLQFRNGNFCPLMILQDFNSLGHQVDQATAGHTAESGRPGLSPNPGLCHMSAPSFLSFLHCLSNK